MQKAQYFWDSLSAWAMGWGGLAGLVGVCLLALWYFTPAFLSSTEARAVLLNASLACIAFAFLSAFFLKQGYDNCAADFAARDKAAIGRGQAGQDELRVCRARGAGWEWDVTSGKCIEVPK